MNIDSHQHFWHYDPGRDAWNTDEMSALKRDFLPENLILPLPANHVEGSIAVQAAQSEADTTFLLELAGRFDEIKGVVGWVDFCSPNLPVGQLQQFDSGEISPWAEQVRLLAANPKVYCKLSGLITEADWRRWRQSHRTWTSYSIPWGSTGSCLARTGPFVHWPQIIVTPSS
jgi:predicted TIM-barrel fold metal-dependent hydrolase